MAEYMESEYIKKPVLKIAVKSYFKNLKYQGKYTIDVMDANADINRIISEMPAADVVEVRHRNTDDENCVICNSEIDEAEAGGLWDLAAEICNELYGYLNYYDEQDTVYNLIRNYIESKNYCPNCGAKMDGKGGEDNV